MFKKIVSAPMKAVAHVKERRGRYAATAGFIAGAVLVSKLDRYSYEDALNFIEEKGLTDEYFLAE